MNKKLTGFIMVSLTLIPFFVMCNHVFSADWLSMDSGTTEDILGVWGSSGTDVFAVGYEGTILHYDGTAWTSMPSGTTNWLSGVWGTSGSDVYAVGGLGYNDHQVILYFDGSSWALMLDEPDTFPLSGVWGTSGSNVYAVGRNQILHYDGIDWAPMSVGPPDTFQGIWGSGENDIFVGGGNQGTIVHYNGLNWSLVHSGFRTSSIWSTSGSDVFFVGFSGGTTLRYDGTNWISMDNGLTNDLYGVWGSSGTDVFAVGSVGMLLHYDGNDWTPMNSGTTENLFGIWGSSSSDVFAVGSNGTILHHDGVSGSCLARRLYGEFSEETALLKSFRDKVLRNSPEGEEIIRLYYQWSPIIVRAMEDDEEFKEDVKELIEGILPMIR
jgi:hypothetical protein